VVYFLSPLIWVLNYQYKGSTSLRATSLITAMVMNNFSKARVCTAQAHRLKVLEASLA